jgi:hypothetical protein
MNQQNAAMSSMHHGLLLSFIIFTSLLATAYAALAGKADVINVKIMRKSQGAYSFDITVRSDDTGWDKYADRWEIVAPSGEVIAQRILQHPHETEQPFTRSLSGVAIPESVRSVTVRAHDKVEGFGGAEMTVEVPVP